MTKYSTFLTVFLISVAALIVFIFFYFQAIFGMAFSFQEHDPYGRDPINILSNLFPPQVIISGVIMALSSIGYRILGIVHVAKSKIVSDGEKALWIVGFILMGFITAIVFLIMARGKQFL